MKNRDLLFIGICIAFSSCSTNENDFSESLIIAPNVGIKAAAIAEELATFSDSPVTDNPTMDHQIIIKYKPNVQDWEKANLRQKYHVINHRECHCSEDIVLWTLDADIAIEPTVKVMNGDDDEDDEPSVDRASRNFTFNTPMHQVAQSESIEQDNEYNIPSFFNTSYLNRIKSSNDGVTIAVIDTGINVEFPGFSGSFLYNSSNGACNFDESGWDFVNEDPNPFDDYPEIHGTVVSYIIHNQLNLHGIPHQILPLKVGDHNGNVRFFDLMCALFYANKEHVEVINLSLGWYGKNKYADSFISNVIDNSSATIITSAGNNGSDNDVVQHYPSGLPQLNLFAIASAKSSLNDATSFTNYGSTSVDFYAVGNKIPFPLHQTNKYINFRGTSFSAPFGSALAAELIFNGHHDVRLPLSQLYSFPILYSKPVFYNKLLR